jgi:hypothetical protein
MQSIDERGSPGVNGGIVNASQRGAERKRLASRLDAHLGSKTRAATLSLLTPFIVSVISSCSSRPWRIAMLL